MHLYICIYIYIDGCALAAGLPHEMDCKPAVADILGRTRVFKRSALRYQEPGSMRPRHEELDGPWCDKMMGAKNQTVLVT